MEDERLLTTQETLERLGVRRSTLYAMIERGEITPIRERAVVRRQPLKFRQSDVERLLAERPAMRQGKA